MMKLMHELLKARVRPYYIYMADQVAGGEHFRTTVQKGLEIIKALRGWTSGLAVPQFVIDAPGGGGKVPLLPEYVEEINDDEVIFRNYEGKRFSYKQPRQMNVPSEEPMIAAEANDVVPIEAGQDGEEGSRRTAEEVGERLTRRPAAHSRPRRSLDFRERLGRDRVGVLLAREAAGAHVVGPAARALLEHGAPLGVALDELRDVALAEPEQVVEDEHLAVRARAGADADHRDRRRAP